MALRVNEKSPWCGAYRRAQVRDFHVLVNFGDGRVAFVREKDLDRDPIWLINQVKQRAELKVFNIRDILSDKVASDVVEHLVSNKWKICRIANEFILENALAVIFNPPTFTSQEIFNTPENPDLAQFLAELLR